jgi:hypothetical protein
MHEKTIAAREIAISKFLIYDSLLRLSKPPTIR